MAPPRRERERYRRASLAEQLGGELRALRRHPGVIVALLAILGGGAVILIARPAVVQVRDLAAGDCLYVRAADAAEDELDPRIGSAGAVVEALYRDGAERAACDLSHSHEVLDAWAFEERAIDPYPGSAVLQERRMEGCEAAFTAHVGRPAEGSAFSFVVAVPAAAAWDRGTRAAACLLARRDGRFLSAPARGSGD